jgi:hypothetical protein
LAHHTHLWGSKTINYWREAPPAQYTCAKRLISFKSSRKEGLTESLLYKVGYFVIPLEDIVKFVNIASKKAKKKGFLVFLPLTSQSCIQSGSSRIKDLFVFFY